MSRNEDLLEELNVEEFAKSHPADCEKPHARFFVIRVDGEATRVKEAKLTGAEILKLVGKSPETHRLYQRFCGGHKERVEPCEIVSFRAPGVERFMTIPCDTTEGESSVLTLRREFGLPSRDLLFLGERGSPWEAVLEGGARWFLLHEFPIPDGYTIESTSVALCVPDLYPEAEFNMVYFAPALQCVSGKAIGALNPQQLDGKVWQRWSRHRTPANPWRVGVDCVETHLLLVDEWLRRECA